MVQAKTQLPVSHETHIQKYLLTAGIKDIHSYENLITGLCFYKGKQVL